MIWRARGRFNRVGVSTQCPPGVSGYGRRVEAVLIDALEAEAPPKAWHFEQRSHSFAECDRVLHVNRQELVVPPQRAGSLRQSGRVPGPTDRGALMNVRQGDAMTQG